MTSPAISSSPISGLLPFQAATHLKQVKLPVTFADGATETLDADAATTASEMCHLLASKIELKDQFGFSIYICIYDKVIMGCVITDVIGPT